MSLMSLLMKLYIYLYLFIFSSSPGLCKLQRTIESRSYEWPSAATTGSSMTIYSRDNTVVDATRCAHKRESSQSTSFTAVMHSPSSFLTHPSNALFPFLRATSNVHGILNQGSCSAPPTEIKQGCTKAGKKSCRPPPPFLTHPPSCAHPFPPSGRRSTARAAAARREWENAGGRACETWRGRPAPLSGDPSTGCGGLTEEGEEGRRGDA